MPSLVVVGAQWGDEGKGKLVDYLTTDADWVVRFQGGNNAGHTLVVNGVTYKLHLIPSGVLHTHSRCAIAAGVVIDPDVFLTELAELEKAGIPVTPENLIIDRDAHLIMEYHRVLDQALEERRGGRAIGTTGRGIGPCYVDRATRSGVRMAELLALDELKEKIERHIERSNAELEHVLGSSLRVSFDSVWSTVQNAAEKLSPFINNVSLVISNARVAEERIVFEGAQGTLLDQVHGTIPFVTSSNTIAGAVTTGVGIGPRTIDYVLGVAKAYTTRVGAGPFPTELHDSTGDYLGEKGHEFGTTTGRKRRCGWFDTVAMKRAARLNGFDSIAITKLDVLSGLEKIKICIKYMLDGQELDDVPSLSSELDRVEPVYIELDGWEENIEGVRKWHQLPTQARLYLSTIAEIIACPVSIVSVSPERDSTIFSSSAAFVKNFVR